MATLAVPYSVFRVPGVRYVLGIRWIVLYALGAAAGTGASLVRRRAQLSAP